MDVRLLHIVHRDSALFDVPSRVGTVHSQLCRDHGSDQIHLLIPEGGKVEHDRFEVVRIRAAGGKELAGAFLRSFCLLFPVNDVVILVVVLLV